MELKGESRPALLKVGSRAVSLEFVPVVPEEDKVSLVMEGENLAAVEVGTLREHGSKHAADAVPGHCVEVVEDQLWVVVMACGTTVVGDIVAELDSRDTESGSGTLRKVTDDQGVYNW
jgi:hypothetical protein